VLPIQQPVGDTYQWTVLVAGRCDKHKVVGAGSGNDGSVQTDLDIQ
jgi:hypothetical protein